MPPDHAPRRRRPLSSTQARLLGWCWAWRSMGVLAVPRLNLTFREAGKVLSPGRIRKPAAPGQTFPRYSARPPSALSACRTSGTARGEQVEAGIVGAGAQTEHRWNRLSWDNSSRRCAGASSHCRGRRRSGSRARTRPACRRAAGPAPAGKACHAGRGCTRRATRHGRRGRACRYRCALRSAQQVDQAGQHVVGVQQGVVVAADDAVPRAGAEVVAGADRGKLLVLPGIALEVRPGRGCPSGAGPARCPVAARR